MPWPLRRRNLGKCSKTLTLFTYILVFVVENEYIYRVSAPGSFRRGHPCHLAVMNLEALMGLRSGWRGGAGGVLDELARQR